jgi:hypothetical protein
MKHNNSTMGLIGVLEWIQSNIYGDASIRGVIEEEEKDLVTARCNMLTKGDARSSCILGISCHRAKLYYFIGLHGQPVNLPFTSQVSMAKRRG